MTCIVGLQTPNGAILGADSALSDSWGTLSLLDSKLYSYGRTVIGFAGENAGVERIISEFRDPGGGRQSDWRTIRDDISEEIRRLASGGIEGVTLLVARGRCLAVFDGSLVAVRFRGPYAAIGCGAAWAYGSLWQTQRERPRRAPKARVRCALECAEAHALGVRRPWTWATTRA